MGDRGYDQKIFQDKKLVDEFVCLFCLGVLKNPVITPKGCEFCESCILECITSHNNVAFNCPACQNENIEQSKLNESRRTRQTIDSLNTHCLNFSDKTNPCHWKGPRSAFETHMNICPVELVPCNCLTDGCKGKVFGRDLETHRKIAFLTSKKQTSSTPDIHGFKIVKCRPDPDLPTAVYCGEWKDGKRHGQGLLKFSENNWYQGEWQNDKMHGYGVEKCGTWKHAGWFKNGLKHGQGTITYSNGRAMSNVWVDNMCSSKNIILKNVSATSDKSSVKKIKLITPAIDNDSGDAFVHNHLDAASLGKTKFSDAASSSTAVTTAASGNNIVAKKSSAASDNFPKKGKFSTYADASWDDDFSFYNGGVGLGRTKSVASSAAASNAIGSASGTNNNKSNVTNTSTSNNTSSVISDVNTSASISQQSIISSMLDRLIDEDYEENSSSRVNTGSINSVNGPALRTASQSALRNDVIDLDNSDDDILNLWSDLNTKSSNTSKETNSKSGFITKTSSSSSSSGISNSKSNINTFPSNTLTSATDDGDFYSNRVSAALTAKNITSATTTVNPAIINPAKRTVVRSSLFDSSLLSPDAAMKIPVVRGQSLSMFGIRNDTKNNSGSNSSSSSTRKAVPASNEIITASESPNTGKLNSYKTPFAPTGSYLETPSSHNNVWSQETVPFSVRCALRIERERRDGSVDGKPSSSSLSATKQAVSESDELSNSSKTGLFAKLDAFDKALNNTNNSNRNSASRNSASRNSASSNSASSDSAGSNNRMLAEHPVLKRKREQQSTEDENLWELMTNTKKPSAAAATTEIIDKSSSNSKTNSNSSGSTVGNSISSSALTEPTPRKLKSRISSEENPEYTPFGPQLSKTSKVINSTSSIRGDNSSNSPLSNLIQSNLLALQKNSSNNNSNRNNNTSTSVSAAAATSNISSTANTTSTNNTKVHNNAWATDDTPMFSQPANALQSLHTSGSKKSDLVPNTGTWGSKRSTRSQVQKNNS